MINGQRFLRLALFQSKWRGRRPLVSSKVNIDPGQALCGEPTLLSNQFKPLLLQVQRLMNDETYSIQYQKDRKAVSMIAAKK